MSPYTYEYPRPAVTVDIVCLRDVARGPEVLLIQRDREPFAGCWALPGGFVDMDETTEAAAARELQEETGLSDPALREVGVFSEVNRDLRGRVISVAYYSCMPAPSTGQPTRRVQAGDDARDATWFPMAALPALAFDHENILAAAMQRMGDDLQCGVPLPAWARTCAGGL